MTKFIATWLLVLMAGCSTVHKENLTPYRDLLPDGATPSASVVPLDPASLKTKTVVIVASSSFNEHVKAYDFHERGLAKHHRTFHLNKLAKLQRMSGQDDTDMKTLSKATTQDPRLIGEEIALVLAQSFAKVGVAETFDEAIAMKADYIVLADYWWAGNSKDRTFISGASVHLLDNSLNRFFVVEARAAAPIVYPHITHAFEQLHVSLTRDLQVEMRRRLHAP